MKISAIIENVKRAIFYVIKNSLIKVAKKNSNINHVFCT